jgi:hypothetical protein
MFLRSIRTEESGQLLYVEQPIYFVWRGGTVCVPLCIQGPCDWPVLRPESLNKYLLKKISLQTGDPGTH